MTPTPVRGFDPWIPLVAEGLGVHEADPRRTCWPGAARSTSAQELRLILELAGFTHIRFEARYTGGPASVDATDIVAIADRAPAW
ncbi:MAG: hypothetical protein WBV06_18855 [Acidimicrobiia bacterium]